MTPDHGQLLYEGKAKRVYASADADKVLVEFKNDATAFNAQKRAQLENKGFLNCQISARLFEHLDHAGVPTHYIGLAEGTDTWMVVKPVEIIPLEVVLRNVAAGSLCRQTPISPGSSLDPALLDLYYKDDNLGDPLLTEARVKLLGVADEPLLSAIEELARKVNATLLSFFAGLDLTLVDFKLEFGITQTGQLLLADEISPDTCRLWDCRTADAEAKIMDKDRFRQDLGGVIEAYGEVFKRVQGACPNPRNCL